MIRVREGDIVERSVRKAPRSGCGTPLIHRGIRHDLKIYYVDESVAIQVIYRRRHAERLVDDLLDIGHADAGVSRYGAGAEYLSRVGGSCIARYSRSNGHRPLRIE